MLLLILFSILPLAFCLPTTYNSPPTWLTAHLFLNRDAANNTFLTFHFHDTDPAHKADLICSANNTAYNGTHVCGANRELLYRVSDNEIVLTRKMHVNSTVMGTARQATNWVEGINMTETEGGMKYSRDEDWLFPITSASG